MFRYTPKRKAQILRLIEEGKVSEEEIMRRHGISSAELHEWESLIGNYGVDGLRTTMIQTYRRFA